MKKWITKRALPVLLSIAVIMSTGGIPAQAVSGTGTTGQGNILCEHHTAHTDDCGYQEETPGTPCGHEHTEDCYTEVTECVHEHTPECYRSETEDSVSDNEATPANAKEREPENCPHICDKESGCITEKLDCRHEHDSECGYTESTPGTPCAYVCEICNPKDSGEAGREPEDTGICKHHQEHDDACGYQPESEDSEGSPCTYECRICPIEDLIAALPDKVTEDNGEDVRAQLDEILALFGELTEDEQEQLDLSRCYELQGALDGANAPVPVEGHAEQQENDIASVTVDGATTYYEDITEAWNAVQGKTATLKLLKDVTVNSSDILILTGGNITLEMAEGVELTGSADYLLQVKKGAALTINSGMIKSFRTAVNVGVEGCAALTINGGTIQSSGRYGVYAYYGSTVTVSGGSIGGGTGLSVEGGTLKISGGEIKSTVDYALRIDSGCQASLSGGTFSGGMKSVYNGNHEGTVGAMLAEGYTYKQDGAWVTNTNVNILTGSVTVHKIPTTINPQGDTSWYYHSGEHSLKMNASPVDGGTVTYVWKNGGEVLDCSEDACRELYLYL